MKNKKHNQIIHVSETHIIIRLHTNETLNVPINELTFRPKVNDIVEVYQNQNHVVVCPLPQSNKLWILITSITLLLLTIIGATFLFFRHPDRNIETVDSHSSQQISSTTSSSSASSSSSSSTSTTSSSSTEDSIIDTTAEELRDMENDGRLKTGQLYRFTAELTRKKFWESYVGHFKALNTYHTIWVKASNAPITGVQVQIKKSMIEGWQEGATVTFTIKIMEDSEKFQFWVATDATLITTPTEEKHTENTTQEIDTQAILHGDYSSIAGTWRNELGHEIVFNKNGLVKGGQIYKSGIGSDGQIGFSVSTGPTGYGMSVYPIGVTIKWVDSDLSKNRIIAGQTAPNSSEQVFYKID
ncbi:hypothetical protein GEZ73_07125 [Streptococcus mitis]|jgi:hypothetical protein|uniref:DUF6287 domain-containing protein n=1 Tax=Streptococcus mitis TaxID=28037 RepID=A0A6L5H700_STRMT|nr:DUF6287 domain-containing protein [Streptococcus mitis]MQP60663.1 hypothetical protein [Streptococcus mitis]MQP70063.1 hypothetical protein [Streptococcus mitis]MQP72023.1 hypothetical protein [Streptococcus mitis]MQP74001.1 hypothetical protein [Streptococcus mitis]MQP87263.1 hypothetical protein [Streptococcus mitis]